MQKNIASQQFVVFAFNATTNVPVTGDAANITATISKDFAADVATNDINPTETQKGFYVFDATQAETNADDIQVFPSSVTANIQVISVPGLITTVPVSFADGVIQTADHTTAIADIPNNSEFNARTLVAADYFDPAADTVANVTLVATTTTNTDMRGTDGANTVVPPSVAQFNARTRLDADYFSWATDTVASVTLVGTTTTNTDMRGTDSAATAAQVSALNDISVLDIFAGGDVDGYTLDESLRLLLSTQVGKASGMSTTTALIRAADDSKTRITATVDSNGNRTALTLDAI